MATFQMLTSHLGLVVPMLDSHIQFFWSMHTQPAQGHPRGPAVLQACVHLWGQVGVLPWDVGSVAVLAPDSGSCPGHNLCHHAMSPHCPQPIGAAPRQSVDCDGIHGALSRPGDLVSGCPPSWSALGPLASFSGLSELQPGLECWCPRCSVPSRALVLTVCEHLCSHGAGEGGRTDACLILPPGLLHGRGLYPPRSLCLLADGKR